MVERESDHTLPDPAITPLRKGTDGTSDSGTAARCANENIAAARVPVSISTTPTAAPFSSSSDRSAVLVDIVTSQAAEANARPLAQIVAACLTTSRSSSGAVDACHRAATSDAARAPATTAHWKATTARKKEICVPMPAGPAAAGCGSVAAASRKPPATMTPPAPTTMGVRRMVEVAAWELNSQAS